MKGKGERKGEEKKGEEVRGRERKEEELFKDNFSSHPFLVLFGKLVPLWSTCHPQCPCLGTKPSVKEPSQSRFLI